MVHIALHFVAPCLVVAVFYRATWRRTALILLATMLVDLDHLLTVPFYDPERCSIDLHPLHTTPAIVLYAGLFALPLVLRRRQGAGPHPPVPTLHLVGLGLLVHMALDWIDCVV